MAERIQAIRGMNDLLPEQSLQFRHIERTFFRSAGEYGYQEIRLPLLEQTQLFKRTIGEMTDIVEKEMYTFNDLNGDSLTLRPEGTAGCVRACLEHGLLHRQQQKLMYSGPMFRHERPQKGRYRQFNQLGLEVFGIPGVGIELELISLCKRFWETLGVSRAVALQVNTLGTLSERQVYRDVLVSYLQPHWEQLDGDSQRRLTTNPLRILDSKNPEISSLIANAPRLMDVISAESRGYFSDLCLGLDALSIPYTVNPCLVRGLDYYGHTVFEWVTDHLGSQATVCAGGRYDVLVEQLGGHPTPAVGFAMGVERLAILMETLSIAPVTTSPPHLFLMATGVDAIRQTLVLGETLRSHHWHVLVHTAGGGFKSQFKKADKSGARFALILGDDEIRERKISIKDLRQPIEQVTIPLSELVGVLSGLLTEQEGNE
ncbi:MAG: histidine--tRNA ligase [Legionellales bacterium]|nr:histidine--tRNA ligase [Legionellales bacterium]